jgi:hypothetical protein
MASEMKAAWCAERVGSGWHRYHREKKKTHHREEDITRGKKEKRTHHQQ